MSPAAWTLSSLLALLVAATSAPARAQAPSPSSPATLAMPTLLEPAEVDYPPDLDPKTLEGHVDLRLTLDAQGTVVEAELVASTDPTLGDAIRRSALRWRFTPARRDGTPIAARILHRHLLRANDAPSTTPPPASPSTAPRPLPPPAASSATPTATAPAPLEIAVQGLSRADRLRQSASAVQVVETERARRESADLGQLVARTQGVGVRRSGGLGSTTRFSLNGLTDDQIRFFLDGVPLDMAGFGLGLANVPVNLVDRVDIYRGVVPIHLGTDALGGAVNLVTDDHDRRTGASASYQIGSFGTHRWTLAGRYHHAPTGLFAAASGFLDLARNDYTIDVEQPDDRGRFQPLQARRFHDAYAARGASVELGLVGRPWTRRLVARLFVTDHDKELQHNPTMTVPYGEVTHGGSSLGATLRYEHTFPLAGAPLSVSALLGAARRTTHFTDLSPWVYDWLGHRVRPRVRPGEMGNGPSERTLQDDSFLARLNLGWLLAPEHTLRLSIAPTLNAGQGEDRLFTGEHDPLAAPRDTFRVITGLEHQAELVDRRLQNLLFSKHYLLRTTSEEVVAGAPPRPFDLTTQQLGAGDALRFRFTDWLWTKASYEYATRLPRPDEIFGNGVLIVPNLDLQPETSHNVNLGLTAETAPSTAGSFRADVNGFLRDIDQMIALLASDLVSTYANIAAARALGVEAALGWTSPGEHLALDGNVTFQDIRNTATEGSYARFAGDRMPNRPWLLANASARLQHRGLASPNDEAALTYYVSYVHEFFRSWESSGQRQSKQQIPSQLLHSLALTYVLRGDPLTTTSSLEIQNLTDETLYDFFGAQRPGRAIFFKGTLEL
ncbi:TonB-dependent siderophore myxochelin receptor MxcH [Chondromyces crocatus]|uniref:Ligand-gated channel protein n=1 Tax=Chondromyces crocatus TaxID=52 RepID=A0A0K1EBZ9_CHOCO|nr:TonB-dependent siderophore myxochelin receptor MxcH [Chondromyces crocatus]AKT38202.1 ligand-gated channel protein [Chondromyces crocatus]